MLKPLSLLVGSLVLGGQSAAHQEWVGVAIAAFLLFGLFIYATLKETK